MNSEKKVIAVKLSKDHPFYGNESDYVKLMNDDLEKVKQA